MSARQPIPMTIIGGFLGAGKTTLLNRLLTTSSGHRLAVLVNDFGAINIDADLIQSHDGTTIALSNGCICCSIGDSLVTTLLDLLALDSPPDKIVIEASGVADPQRLADIALADPTSFRLDGVIVLASAQTIMDVIHDGRIGNIASAQIAAADMIVLNKIDLVDAQAVDRARASLAQLAPHTPILPTIRADIVEAIAPTGHRLTSGIREGIKSDEASHDSLFASLSLTSKDPISAANLERYVAAWPTTLLRAKGYAAIADEPGHIAVVNLVGKRREITRLDASDFALDGAARFVFIAVAEALDRQRMEKDFHEAFGALPVSHL